MEFSKLIFFAFVSLLMCFAAANIMPERKSHKRNRPNHPTFVVDPKGNGNFSTIQSAINHVRPNNVHWIRIYIKAGDYKEQVQIPSDKPYIYLQGEGKWRTRVYWDGFQNLQTSATFTSQADNIVVKSISFMNTYNYPLGVNKNLMTPAVAGMIAGDKSAFYRVAFVGLQDTLWDVSGRHYFSHCTIQGAVDFIFGAGQSIYQRCVISVVAGVLQPGLAGFITAQARSDPSETNGFIFKECNVIGNGMTFLGRPWRDYARVIFLNSTLSDIVVPAGWNSWTTDGREYQLTFAEHGCKGGGSNTSQRVSWEYKLTKKMILQLSNISFVDDEGWISSLPLNLAT